MLERKSNKRFVPVKQPIVSSEKGIFHSDEIKSLELKKIKVPQIGCGDYGIVYSGKVVFKNGSKQRIAIKKFHQKLSDDAAKRYQDVIDDLRTINMEYDKAFPKRQLGKAKLFPKAAMIKTNIFGESEWVMVSQLFYSNNYQKVSINGSFDINSYKNFIKNSNKKEYCWIFSKLIEKGYYYAPDLLVAIKNGLLPIDLDFLGRVGKELNLPFDKKATLILNSVGWVTGGSKESGDTIELLIPLLKEKKLKSELIKQAKEKKIIK
ncbi:MAG: hypothetical protein WCX82_01650 [archaeon]|jgi:hypothetical protein